MVRRKCFDRTEKLKIAALGVLCFFAHMLVINQFSGWLCTGTDEYWLHAATFTGHDWSGVASKTNVYGGWGYSLILMIPFLVTNDILIMSKIVVVINSLFCALTVPLLHSIGKRIAKGVDQRVVMISVAITSMYSTYVLESAVALTETLLFFLYILLLWMLLNYIDTHKRYWAVLCGVCCGYSYVVHHKMIGIIIAFAIVIVFRYARMKDWKESLCFIIPVTVLILLGNGVDHWLELKEGFDSVINVNTFRVVGSTLPKAFSLKGILSIVENVIGEVWYLLTGTFLIAGLGVITLIRKFWAGRIAKDDQEEKETDHQYLSFYAYVILTLVIMMGMSAVVLHREWSILDRIDSVFYGRYFEFVVGILLFTGLIELSKLWEKKERKKDMGLLFVLAISTSVLVYYFAKGIGGSVVDYFSVPAVLFPFSYPNVPFSVAGSSICFLTLETVFICLLLRHEWIYRRISYLLILVSFCFIGYNAVDGVKEVYEESASIANFPLHNGDFSELNNYLSDNEVNAVYVYSQNGIEAFSFQIFQPDMEVIAVDSMADISDGAGEYLIIPQDIVGEWEAMEPVMITETYILCKL